jgi:DNA-binding winged helix-turn-helix (wHTH) protein
MGVRIKLQSKPAQALEILASRPNDLVRREELCNQLWPRGVFVDVESGLNTAMNRLRAALTDTAEQPLYIQTVPRLGYRFICPVQDVNMQMTADEPFDPFIDLPSNRFPENMFLRLAIAIMLAFACQLFVFYLDLPATVSHVCVIK